jgi:Zn-finger nucleic acid-binding protein
VTTRQLVACPTCGRQFDASGRGSGTRFRCLCGAAVTVPAIEAHDAAVVRCSSCGAPRQGGAPRCSFCGADFTLRERDLGTLCPRCASRISNDARFCHACGLPIAPQALAGEPTSHGCPAWGAAPTLSSRRFPGQELSFLECERCAGMWLSNTLLERLEQSARQERSVEPPTAVAPAPSRPTSGPLYRPCPICSRLMNRRNQGRKSGVIVDVCAAHGVWFDDGELDKLLLWIRRGGERAAAREHRIEERESERQRRLYPVADEPDDAPQTSPLFDLLGAAFAALFR